MEEWSDAIACCLFINLRIGLNVFTRKNPLSSDIAGNRNAAYKRFHKCKCPIVLNILKCLFFLHFLSLLSKR